eukprot:UC1_evm1s1509
MPRITQETFDAVVKENQDEFEMELAEAIEDAIEQFKTQGVDLSMVNTDVKLDADGNVMEPTIKSLLRDLTSLTTTKDEKEEKEEKEGEPATPSSSSAALPPPLDVPALTANLTAIEVELKAPAARTLAASE